MFSTLADGLKQAITHLTVAGLDHPQREARRLLAHHLKVPPETVLAFPERSMRDPAGFQRLVARRAGREPLSRIIGRREFWGLDFQLSPAVLDPRSDSETLVEAALSLVPNGQTPLRLLDLGTGSGCLLLALLSEWPDAVGLGVDCSETALMIARQNAIRLGLVERCLFVQSNWAEGVAGSFEIILCNPPYIRQNDLPALQPEVVQYDPPQALDGGPDGLRAYRTLIPQAFNRLIPDGWLVLEIGMGQAGVVQSLMREAGFTNIQTRRDLARVERCLAGQKTGER